LVAVAVIDLPTGTVLFATKSFIEAVPLTLLFTRVSPTKVLPPPVSRGSRKDQLFGGLMRAIE
jgi:hypothetical protein